MRDQTRCKVSRYPVGHLASLLITARFWLDPHVMTSDLTLRKNQADFGPSASNGDADLAVAVANHQHQIQIAGSA